MKRKFFVVGAALLISAMMLAPIGVASTYEEDIEKNDKPYSGPVASINVEELYIDYDGFTFMIGFWIGNYCPLAIVSNHGGMNAHIDGKPDLLDNTYDDIYGGSGFFIIIGLVNEDLNGDDDDSNIDSGSNYGSSTIEGHCNAIVGVVS